MLLAKPGRIGPLKLKNRVIMAPMGTNYVTTDGYSTDCLSPLKLCHLLVRSWGGWHGPEAAFGRRYSEAST